MNEIELTPTCRVILDRLAAAGYEVEVGDGAGSPFGQCVQVKVKRAGEWVAGVSFGDTVTRAVFHAVNYGGDRELVNAVLGVGVAA